MAATDRPPYPGLRSFRREETDLFFGRDDCVEAMVARLAATRFLAVLGSSGTGKSSLVKTGLLSGLEMGLLDGAGSRWQVVDFRPGGAPLRNLARRLIETERGEAEGAAEVDDMEVDLLLARLKRGPRALIEWCRDGHPAPGTNLLVLVDQFEELFRYQDYAGREEAEAFVALLLESRHPTDAADPRAAEFPIYITITMRSEYLGACALIEGLAEAINEGTFLTPRMTREQCREAIVGPARVCEVEIEPALVNRLLNDLANFAPWDAANEIQLDRQARRADQLPLLQYTLNRMWEGAKDRGRPITLTVADYVAIGGLSGALDKHANTILAVLKEELGPARGAAVTSAVFRALTLGNSVADAVRRPTRFGELVAVCGGDRAGVTAVVEAFRAPGCNFLTPEVDPRKPHLDDGANVDISHESLIRQWAMLSQWLEREGRAAHEWRRLEEDAARGELLGGQRLALAVARHAGTADGSPAETSEIAPNATWARRYGIDFERVNAFIAASVKAEDERSAAETAREAERQRAENERLRAESARRWWRYAFAAVAVMVIVVGGLAGYAYREASINRHYYDAVVHQADVYGGPLGELATTMAFDTDTMDKMRLFKEGQSAEQNPTGGNQALADFRAQWWPQYGVAQVLIKMLDEIRANDPRGYSHSVQLPRAHLMALTVTAALRPDLNSAEAKAGHRKVIDIAQPLVQSKLDVGSVDRVSNAMWIASVVLERANEKESAVAMHELNIALLEKAIASKQLARDDAEKYGRWLAQESLRWGLFQKRSGDTAAAIDTLRAGMERVAAATEEKGRRVRSRMPEALADVLLERAKAAKTDDARKRDREEAAQKFALAIERLEPQFPQEFARWTAAAEKDDAVIAAIDEDLKTLAVSDRPDRWDRWLDKKWLEDARWTRAVYSKLGDTYADLGRLKEAGASYAMEFKLALGLLAHDEGAAREKHYDNDQAAQDLAQVLRDLGYWEKWLKHPEQAAHIFTACIDLMRERADRDERNSRNQAKLGFCYRDRGVVHATARGYARAHDDYAAALWYFARAAEDRELDLIPHWQIDTFAKIAGVASDLRQPAQAVAYQDQAMAIAERNYRKQQNQETIDDLSLVYAVASWYRLTNRDTETARTYALKAYEIRKETFSTSPWGENLVGAVNLAHAYLFNDEFDAAKEIYAHVARQRCGEGSCARDIKEDFALLRELQFVHPGMCAIGKLIGDEAYANAECEAPAPQGPAGRNRAAR